MCVISLFFCTPLESRPAVLFDFVEDPPRSATNGFGGGDSGERVWRLDSINHEGRMLSSSSTTTAFRRLRLSSL